MWHIEHFDQIDSTNTWLGDRARDGAPEGTVVFADFQSAGRGRLDRTWDATPGTSLLCSILFRPSLESSDLQLTVAIVALAARAALVRLCGLRPSLKWPNDLLAGDLKLAGLLAELVATPSGPAVVVGIGINLRDVSAVNPRATSVKQESGVTISARALLDILLEELEPRRYLLDSAEGRAVAREEYSASLGTIGQRVRVEQRDVSFVGLATGIDDAGHLLVDIDGVETSFMAGDVVHVRTEGTE